MNGFSKNLLSGTLSFFVGLFGGKKSQENQPSTKAAEKPAATTAEKPAATTAGKPAAANAKKNRKRSGYFMELDEAEDVKPLNGNQPAPVAAAKTPEPVAAAKSAKAEPAKTPKPAAAAKSAKAEPAKTPDPAAATQPPKVELVQTAEGVKAVPAKPASSSPAASANGQKQTETTFAPKYLAPSGSSNSRRRPGPSMNTFLDMARQVKTPG